MWQGSTNFSQSGDTIHLLFCDSAALEVNLLRSLKFVNALITSTVSVVWGTNLAFGQGTVVSEGLTAHGADVGSGGSGLTIGVLAEPLNESRLNALIGANELPLVSLVGAGYNDPSSSSDLGLNMLQIIHDFAPDAALVFAAPSQAGTVPDPVPSSCAGVSTGLVDGGNALTEVGAFLCALDALQADGVDMIVDGLGPIDTEPFHDGPVALAVSEIANEIPYIIAAGEEGSLEEGGTYVSKTVYEAPFNGIALPQDLDLGAGFEYVELVHGFTDPAAPEGPKTPYLLIKQPLDEVCLYWADQPGASVNDYDLFLIEATNITPSMTVAARSTDFQYAGGDQSAKECLSNPETGDPLLTLNRRIVVGTDAIAAENRYLHIRATPSTLDEFGAVPSKLFSETTGGAIRGRAGLANVITVGSATYNNGRSDGFDAFSAGDPVDEFSSAGYRTVFYTYSNGAYVAIGDDQYDLDSSAEVRIKPNVAGAQAVDVAEVGSVAPFTVGGSKRVYGSSVAAANIAGVIARAQPTDYNPITAELLSAVVTAAVDLGLDNSVAGNMDSASGAGAPTVSALLNELAKPMSPVNADLSYGTASAILTFENAPDHMINSTTYTAACFQRSPSGTESPLPILANVTSGQTFTVIPGYSAYCNLRESSQLESDAICVGACAGEQNFSAAEELAATTYSVSADAYGFTIRYTTDAAGDFSNTLRCTAVGNDTPVVDDSSDPTPSSASYEDLAEDITLTCNLMVNAEVAGVAQPGASLQTTFTVTPEAGSTGLPIWLLYEATRAKTPAPPQ